MTATRNIRDRGDGAGLWIAWTRRVVLLSLIIVSLSVVAPVGGAAPAAADPSGAIVEAPVSFQVKNTNTSRVTCLSDGADYTVGGTLVGPQDAIESAGSKVVTLYLHSLDTGAWYWTFPIEGYDYALEMARLGHTSLVVDRIGYDSSGHPDGFQSCVGSQADVAHQLVTQLRGGTYGGTSTPSFSKVVLAGHSISGLISQIEAYSYRDIDGLIVNGWTDNGSTPALISGFAQVGALCAAGGEPAEPGGPGGYLFFDQSDDDFKNHEFEHPDPAVIAAGAPLRNRNPCGDMASIPAGIGSDNQGLGEIEVPVLGVFANQDQGFQGGDEQMTLYTGSKDVTGAFIEGSGHFMALDAKAAEFRSVISNWLTKQGFISAVGSGSGSAVTSGGGGAGQPAAKRRKCKGKKRVNGKKHKRCKRR